MEFDKEPKPVTKSMCAVINIIVGLFALVIAAILYLTVFKAVNPKITVKSVTVSNLYISKYPDLQHSVVGFTVKIYRAVKNPNVERFKSDNNTIVFYYYGTQIGMINFIPKGQIMAQKFEYLSAALAVEPFPFIPHLHPNLFSDANSSKIIPIDFTVSLGGDVRVLYFFRSYVESVVHCNFILAINAGTILKTECS